MRTINLSVVLTTVFFGGVVQAQPASLWNESVDGDLPNEVAAPKVFSISEPGEYLLQLTTGPVFPVRLETPLEEIPRRQSFALRRLDTNGDSRLQRSEVVSDANYTRFFELYDANGNNEIEFPEEILWIGSDGDSGDLFTFEQADGVNLVAITLKHFDSGGPRNDVSAFAVMDSRYVGPQGEVGGVQMTDLDPEAPTRRGEAMAATVNPNPDGVEIYERYDLWKAYRRNDPTSYFRIGEGQEKAITELIFVFE